MVKLIKADFHGEVIQFNDDGWFNATFAAKKFGKRPGDWLKNQDTKEYIKSLSAHFKREPESLYKTRKGKSVAGTWLHPKLAVPFARWCDVEFSIWCDDQIDKIIHGEPEKENWKKLRHTAAVSYPIMSDMLMNARKDLGKETKHFHYANEAKLINWALTGEFKSVDRDSLPIKDLDLIAKLEIKNTMLLARGVDRDTRKEILSDMTLNNHNRINK